MPVNRLSALPIDAVLPEIAERLGKETSLVIEAPPGAGKTTRVPPAMLDLVDGEIIVLEPRRIAARMAARRVAQELGERLGERVGYTVRFDDVPGSRIRFVTEGVLVRRMLTDGTLAGVSAVVLDEFHERHLHADVALALLDRLRRVRPDLRVVVMSATLEARTVAGYLGASSVRSEGRLYDVSIEHETKRDDRPLASRVSSAVRSAMSDDGHVLVFLPGAADIRACTESCEPVAREHGALLLPLHGELSPEEQDRAVLPSVQRKILLSTNVAESSLTIDGVSCVVDSGLVRRAGYAPWSRLGTLRVEKASRASCTQRMGRAGRTRVGRCIRLYSRADFDARPEHDVPEIQRADLTRTILELGAMDLAWESLRWLDPPDPKSVESAKALLLALGALSKDAITERGRTMARIPLHPRLAALVVSAAERGGKDDGCTIAALLSERDIRFESRDRKAHRASERSDVLAMLDLYREVEASGFSASSIRAAKLDQGAVHSVRRAVRQIVQAASAIKGKESGGTDRVLEGCIFAGFSDLAAKRVRGRDVALAGGGRAELAETSVVRDAPFFVCVDAEQRDAKVLVRVASAFEPDDVLEHAPDALTSSDRVTFDEKSGKVVRLSQSLLGAIALDETITAPLRDERTSQILFEAMRARFKPSDELGNLLDRVAFARTIDSAIPPLEIADVLRTMCDSRISLGEVGEVRAEDAALGALGASVPVLDRIAPQTITLPSGRRTRVNYEGGKAPWVASRLQDFFGMTSTPTVGNARVPLVVHLLAPNQRAVQVTQDLDGFWKNHYPTLRKQLMRRYPKHAWPERP